MSEELKLDKKKFTEWYERILKYAEVVDDRYPLKGSYVWMPYGFKALKLMMKKIEELLEETGHQDSYFPLLVPISVFKKEDDFLEGFGGSTLRITHVGKRALDEELVMRPTSESVMYYMFSLWIRSWRDLPLKLYQIVPIFRWETKMTKPMLRVREIIKFKEAHTAHATKEEADKQVKEAVEIYTKFFDFLRVPYIILKTPEWNTFAGALCNYDHITVMPDGKAAELSSVINLGQKYAKAFDIKYLDKNEKKQYVWQTCYGISERALGVVLSLHGDNKGLIFTSEIAPIQIIIIPILTGNKDDEKLTEAAKKLKKELKEYRVEIDSSEDTAGTKFFHWEAKGVPVRIEIGEKELKEKNVTVVRRDTGKEEVIKNSELKLKLKKIFNDIDENLYKTSEEFLKSMIFEVKSIEEAKKILEKKGGIIKIPWCGNNSCGKQIEEKLVGEALGIDEKEKGKDICPVCKNKAKNMLHFARTY